MKMMLYGLPQTELEDRYTHVPNSAWAKREH